MSYEYSPHPVAAYRLAGVPRDEVTVLMSLGARASAAWNLAWLSYPLLDNIPLAGPAWHKVYRPLGGLLAAVIRDISTNEPFARKLAMHPTQFDLWFADQVHHEMWTYDIAGRDQWVERVQARTREAINRHLHNKPVVTLQGGRLQFDC